MKKNQLLGFDFDRQRCIDNYIVDFYCKDLMLAIEVDGMSHNYEEAFNKDVLRQEKLESFGIYFLRFSEAELKRDLMNVIKTIESTVINMVKYKPSFKLLND